MAVAFSAVQTTAIVTVVCLRDDVAYEIPPGQLGDRRRSQIIFRDEEPYKISSWKKGGYEETVTSRGRAETLLTVQKIFRRELHEGLRQKWSLARNVNSDVFCFVIFFFNLCK